MSDPKEMPVLKGESPRRPQATNTFAVEKKGIDLIYESERHGKASDLFWMWLGTNLNIFYVVNGALIISFGLSFSQAISAILLSNLAFFLVGLTSIQGPKVGTATFAISRAAYGLRGGKSLAFFNWVTLVGFEASGIALIVLAGVAVADRAGVHDSTGLKLALLIVAALLQLALPLFGHALIVAVQKRLAYLFIPLFVIIAIAITPKVHLSSLSKSGSWATFTVAIALLISAGGLSWANTGSDYSRYLPRNVNSRSVFWWSSLGGLVPAVLLELLGAATASVVTTASDPIAGVPAALPKWIGVPYLCFAILTLFAVNTIDLYSSGLTLQALGIRLRRWQCVIVDLAIAIGIAAIALFSSSFSRLYSNFLALLIVWLAPWIAIYLVDWVLRRGHYDAEALVAHGSGRYWGRNGVNSSGITAQIVGMVAAMSWIATPGFTGPLSARFGGSDFSVFTGSIAAGLVYFILAARSIRVQTLASIPIAPESGFVAGDVSGDQMESA